VRIETHAGMAFLNVDGTAQGSGRAGEQIRVRSTLNGRVLKATVRAKGLVSTGESQ
jgi:flagella basal body P-ring formation protein FlgA